MLYVNCRTDKKQAKWKFVPTHEYQPIICLYLSAAAAAMCVCGEMFVLLKPEFCTLQTPVQRKCSRPLLKQSAQTDEMLS